MPVTPQAGIGAEEGLAPGVVCLPYHEAILWLIFRQFV